MKKIEELMRTIYKKKKSKVIKHNAINYTTVWSDWVTSCKFVVTNSRLIGITC